MNDFNTFKYYVIDKNDFVEVDSEGYQNWLRIIGKYYSAPDYTYESNDIGYSMESMFQGAVDKGEEILPFLLFYVEDDLVLTPEGVERKLNRDYVFFFTSLKELESAQNQIIEALEA